MGGLSFCSFYECLGCLFVRGFISGVSRLLIFSGVEGELVI